MGQHAVVSKVVPASFFSPPLVPITAGQQLPVSARHAHIEPSRLLEAWDYPEHPREVNCAATAQCGGKQPFPTTAAANVPLEVSQYSLSSPHQRVPCLLTAGGYRFDTVWLPVYTTGNQRAAASVATGRLGQEKPLHRCLLPRTCSQHTAFVPYRGGAKEERQSR